MARSVSVTDEENCQVNVLYLRLFHRPYTTYNSALWGHYSRVRILPSLSTFSSSNHVSSRCVLSFYQPTPAICFSQADILWIDKITYWQMSYTPSTCTSGMEDIGILSFVWVHSSARDAVWNIKLHQKGIPQTSFSLRLCFGGMEQHKQLCWALSHKKKWEILLDCATSLPRFVYWIRGSSLLDKYQTWRGKNFKDIRLQKKMIIYIDWVEKCVCRREKAVWLLKAESGEVCK